MATGAGLPNNIHDTPTNSEIDSDICKICHNDVTDLCFVGDYNARCYPAHRSLLTYTSGYFRDHFERKPDNDDFEPIYITDVEPSALIQCIDYIYTGHLEVTAKNLRNLAEAALVLKMDAIWDMCVDFATTNVKIESFFDMRMMAASTCCQKLLDATGMFALCNFERLMGHEEFALIDKTLLLFLLQNKKLKMIPERKIYEAVTAWINFNPSKRKEHLPELLHYVALDQIPIDYLKEVIHAEPLVMDDSECRNLLEEALFSHLNSNVITEDGTDTLTQESMFIFDQNLATVTSYNPWSGRWTNYAKYQPGITGKFTAVSVDRSIYILGENRRVFRLDTVDNAWREMSKMGFERGEPRAAVLDSIIYMSGGTSASSGKGMRTAECFNPENNSWEKLQSMKKPRTKHCLASSRGYLYAIGGLNNNNVAVKLVERWGPKPGGGWMNIAPLKRPRCGAICIVKEDSIYVIGGSFTPDVSVEVLNPTVSGWTTLNVSVPKNVVAASVVGDDIFVLCCSDITSTENYEIQELLFEEDQPATIEKVQNLEKFGALTVFGGSSL